MKNPLATALDSLMVSVLDYQVEGDWFKSKQSLKTTVCDDALPIRLMMMLCQLGSASELFVNRLTVSVTDT